LAVGFAGPRPHDAPSMTVAVDFGGTREQAQPQQCGTGGLPTGMGQAAQRSGPPPASTPSQLSGGWHLRLAALLMTLRGCLLGPDREFFDHLHTSAHKRELPTHHFFQFALNVLRQHKPELEDEFREVFRLRNAARRRARQLKAGTLRSVKSESALQDCAAPRGGVMSRSCEDVAAQARSAEEIDETMFRLQALCVQASASEGQTVLTKRHSEMNMYEDYGNNEQKRQTCVQSPCHLTFLSTSP
jgi:hypothetical protein